jgi:membrane associated rhomboid family serine protease
MIRSDLLITPVVKALLILNGGIFIFELFAGEILINLFALWPIAPSGTIIYGVTAPEFQIWQLFSYSFLHGGIAHLLLNMYALWMFGSRIEIVLGSKKFTQYYLVCVLGAALLQLFVASQSASEGAIYPTIGASGGVFGILLAFGMIFPNEKLMLIFPPVILKAKWFVLIYGIIELWAGITGSAAGIAHFAHLGGMLFGYFLLTYWRRHPQGFE